MSVAIGGLWELNGPEWNANNLLEKSTLDRLRNEKLMHENG